MNLRSRLFATVTVPVLTAAAMVEPSAAAAASHASSSLSTAVLVAQTAVTCSDGSQAADQASCDAIDVQRVAEQQAADEAQKAAEQQAAQEAQQAAEQQAAEEAQRAAEQQAADEAQKAAEQQAAEEAQRAAEQQAAEEAQQAAEQQATDEAQKAAEQPQVEQPTAEAVSCADGSQAASADACPAAEPQAPAEAAPVDQVPSEKAPAEEAAPIPQAPVDEATPSDQPAADQAPAEEPAPAEQPADSPLTNDAMKPAPDSTQGDMPVEPQAQSAPAPDQQPAGEQVLVPAVEPPADAPIVDVIDKRSEEDKLQIAEDPAKTAETVVLPVDNGAAVLDSDKDADNTGGADVRDARTMLREEIPVVAAPTSDAEAQGTSPRFEPKVMEAIIGEKGKTTDTAPTFDVPTSVTNVMNVTNVTNVTNNVSNVTNQVNQVNEVRVIEETDNRTIINVGNHEVVRGDDRSRLRYDEGQTFYEELSRGRVRETIERHDGSRLVTVYNRYGDIILRSRFTVGGDEYVLFYAPEADRAEPHVYVDVGSSLPPMRLSIPVQDYIVTTSNAPDRDYYDFLAQPPVERVERVYSIEEVKSSARLRDKVRRIDLDTITFPSGSAEVPLAQAKTLRRVAEAMEQVLAKDPGETFLIEGHTDAVGSDRSNLILSDKRAETVANLLSEVYGIPPENLSVQGYGERYLKIRTAQAEQQNRRVAIRRVTSLVRPAAVDNR
ncbi:MULTISPECIES: OmpA family protein [Alphaproteobacteria]|uniref:Membrane protein n=2 Tax=Alphaproteobacteria TaxID=28211 RepID=A0A512HCC6_9HYPH|nr:MULTISPECIES: OmpA family protein [Alphaproteobacteria]GEO83103.1 membrane protein [Ciceribacter naphthalenivorans]GLR20501.1 membrane protein [Ciceribacter naphthalenivorans]GLT03357.1 membrane protein [Sphingomonas psychrolutea]